MFSAQKMTKFDPWAFFESNCAPIFYENVRFLGKILKLDVGDFPTIQIFFCAQKS
jgi:hypothetical protein